jgi:alkanesulfonate monooxygenase SsuD/methylene tetrahydromethanopterin reductase-like flavin-dependent oxidoreductase (luciferase family)
MVFAEFIARSDGGPAVSAYRAAFAPSAFRSQGWTAVATIALAAETAEVAERLAAPMRASALAGLDGPAADGERPRFARIEDALAFLEARRDDPRLAGVIARAIVGDPDTVRRGLAAKAEATGADEIFVMAVGPDLASRVRSLELIKGG